MGLPSCASLPLAMVVGHSIPFFLRCHWVVCPVLRNLPSNSSVIAIIVRLGREEIVLQLFQLEIEGLSVTEMICAAQLLARWILLCWWPIG
jgi:hypothetical protein